MSRGGPLGVKAVRLTPRPSGQPQCLVLRRERDLLELLLAERELRFAGAARTGVDSLATATAVTAGVGALTSTRGRGACTSIRSASSQS